MPLFSINTLHPQHLNHAQPLSSWQAAAHDQWDPPTPTVHLQVFGWVMSAAILAAIRLSRETTDAERMDVHVLQVRRAHVVTIPLLWAHQCILQAWVHV